MSCTAVALFAVDYFNVVFIPLQRYLEQFATNLDGLITHLQDCLNKNTIGTLTAVLTGFFYFLCAAWLMGWLIHALKMCFHVNLQKIIKINASIIFRWPWCLVQIHGWLWACRNIFEGTVVTSWNSLKVICFESQSCDLIFESLFSLFFRWLQQL